MYPEPVFVFLTLLAASCLVTGTIAYWYRDTLFPQKRNRKKCICHDSDGRMPELRMRNRHAQHKLQHAFSMLEMQQKPPPETHTKKETAMPTVTFILRRSDHYEVHYPTHVEFWSLDLQKQLGTSPTHQVT